MKKAIRGAYVNVNQANVQILLNYLDFVSNLFNKRLSII